ncbi:hypothetical protein ACFX12_035801 [Malus domestica]
MSVGVVCSFNSCKQGAFGVVLQFQLVQTRSIWCRLQFQLVQARSIWCRVAVSARADNEHLVPFVVLARAGKEIWVVAF